MSPDMRRIEDWADRVADIAWSEAVEQMKKADNELTAALEELRRAAVKVQSLAVARFSEGQEPNRIQRPAPDV